MSYRISWKPAATTNFAIGRNNKVPGWLVHHRMVGYLTGTDRHFQKVGVKVSTHFGIGHRVQGGPVEISQYVYLDDRAFGNGNNVDEFGNEVDSTWNRLGYPSRPNEQTISIEHEDGGTTGRGIVTDDIIEASIWLDRQLLTGDPAHLESLGVRFLSSALVRTLARIPKDDRHIVDHHFIAGPLKPYCWQPWLDGKGFPQARYLATLLSVEEEPVKIKPAGIENWALDGGPNRVTTIGIPERADGKPDPDYRVAYVAIPLPGEDYFHEVARDRLSDWKSDLDKPLLSALAGYKLPTSLDCTDAVAAEHTRTKQAAVAAVEAIA